MNRILHLDASARPGRAGVDPHGSLTRLLTQRAVDRWRAGDPSVDIIRRDVGLAPPAPVSARWIEAAFSAPAQHAPWMAEELAESDQLIDEICNADVLVLGVPLYNFSMPASFKAWIDNIVRIGKTVAVEPGATEVSYRPLLADRPVILVAARGGFDMDAGQPMAHLNHLEPSVRTALAFIGLTSVHCVAVEHQETGGEWLAASLQKAETKLDGLVDQLQPAVLTHQAARRA